MKKATRRKVGFVKSRFQKHHQNIRLLRITAGARVGQQPVRPDLSPQRGRESVLNSEGVCERTEGQ